MTTKDGHRLRVVAVETISGWADGYLHIILPGTEGTALDVEQGTPAKSFDPADASDIQLLIEWDITVTSEGLKENRRDHANASVALGYAVLVPPSQLRFIGLRIQGHLEREAPNAHQQSTC